MKVNFNNTSDCKLIGNKLYSVPENKLVAEFYLKNYKYIMFHFITKDDDIQIRKLELYKEERSKVGIVDNCLYNAEGLYVCQYCNRPIMKIYEDIVSSFSIYIECQCGICYDHSRKRK